MVGVGAGNCGAWMGIWFAGLAHDGAEESG